MIDPGADGDMQVTVAVTRVIHPGKEREFARWADEVDAAAAGFAGYLGGVRLHDAQGLNHLIYRFDTPENLRAWENSERRRELLRRGDRLSNKRRAAVAGWQVWFDVTGSGAAKRWKTFLLTWTAVYPTLLILSTVISAVAPRLPRPLGLAVTSLLLTGLLTFVIMPRLTRQARPWLLRGARPRPAERLPERPERSERQGRQDG
jgi:antibiotic biosynthesis monooxygenase (ABM) superfamily enzyme